jgi:hypothetical protein
VRNYLLGLLIATTALVIAACGGQGAPGTPYPAANVNGAALSTAAPPTIAMAATTGLAVGTAKISGSGNVTVSQSVSNPNGVPVLAIGRARASATSSPAPSGNTPIAYVTLTAQSAASVSQVTFSVSPTTAVPSGSYNLAFWNGAQWVTIGSPAQFSAGVVTVSSGTINPAVSVAAGTSYYFAIYTGQIFTTPTPPPSPPVASPASLSLSVGQTGPISVTSGAQITITAVSSNTSVATVTQSASTGTGTTAAFTVTAVSAGTATITFTDPIHQTGTATVNVNNNSPTPSPSPPGTKTIGLGDAAPIGISADPNTQITITTSAYTTAALATGSPGPVPSPVGAAPTTFASTSSVTMTTDGTGAAYFWVQGAAGGYATISLSDVHGNTSTVGLTVSPITNGAFANGATSWAPCSYAHSAGGSPINAASPAPNTPEPVQTGSPTAETPVPLGSLSPLVSVTTPPLNDNPGWSNYTSGSLTPNTGSVTFSQAGNSETITTPGGAPFAAGSKAMLIGSIEGDVEAYPLGTFGVCQTFVVPTPVPNVSGQGDPQLSLYVLEGGTEYTFKEADQEATLFSSYANNVASTLGEYLFVEQNCYVHPTTATPPGIWGGASITGGGAGCWPNTYGGDPSGYENWLEGGFWSPRGPYDLSAYAGQTVTLFLGNWSYFHETHSYNAQFMYVGNVQVTFSSGFPTTAPYIKGRSIGTVSMKSRGVQSTRPIR